jgi:hypothetical protein
MGGLCCTGPRASSEQLRNHVCEWGRCEKKRCEGGGDVYESIRSRNRFGKVDLVFVCLNICIHIPKVCIQTIILCTELAFSMPSNNNNNNDPPPPPPSLTKFQLFFPNSYNLGNMLAHGRGCKKNESAAMARWLNAARENHLGAHFNVGVMYEKGLGLPKPDPLRAIAHYTAAAEKGHKDANFNLAFLYHHGAEGVEPSNRLALRYYARAAALGDHEAQYMLERLKK